MKKTLIFALLGMLTSTSFAAQTIQCSGTEPFWGLKVTESQMRFSNPVIDGEQVLTIVSRAQAAGYTEDVAFVIKSRYARLTAIAGTCSDGMSDFEYSHHALFETDEGITFGGCCNILD